ncbi:MAG TPA: glycosyl hydrolase family 28-related protein [Candidatus Paceibacterota bacterium]|nr:glycosyl hydrolase family 28-related protein [Candidatus Paceibacterota bacterium]
MFVVLGTTVTGFLATAPRKSNAEGNEVFVGPFPSWVNVVKKYGAVGNGITDDTAAIQRALDSLSNAYPGSSNSANATTTIYFPAGTYRITAPLHLVAKHYVNIVGANPADTVILWDGPASTTTASSTAMLTVNGVYHSSIDRLTFNGRGNASIAIDQAWTPGQGFFDSGNEYADDVFENVGVGYRCGASGHGCAESSLLRDQFLNNSVAGVSLQNFNALDIFIWYSLFKNDAIGITNSLPNVVTASSAGNFHVYKSIFENSKIADMAIGNTGLFSALDNYSIDSNQFFYTSGSSAPAHITIQGNTIIDTTNPTSISVNNKGPLLLVDNTIVSSSANDSSSQPVVSANSWNPSILFSMDNSFTSSGPLTYANGSYYSFGDEKVSNSGINQTPPILPPPPPNQQPQIIEVPVNANAAQIQQAISQAAAIGGGTVVHIPAGTYYINTTLLVPANSGLQIIGDGEDSDLLWSGIGTGPVLRLLGPSRAVLKNFSVNGNNEQADGIEVDNADQPGGRVFMEQAWLTNSDTNLFVDGLDYTNTELYDFYHSGLPAGASANAGASVKVVGGPYAAHGLWKGGATNIFSGASSNTNLSYSVSGGAHLMIRDVWYEEHPQILPNFIDLTGTSTLTYAGSRMALQAVSGTPAINIHDFHGTATFLNNDLTTEYGNQTSSVIDINGNDTGADVTGIGLLGTGASYFNNNSNASVQGVLLGSIRRSQASGAADVPDQGSANAQFLTTALNQVQTEQPAQLSPLSPGVTDTRFYRVAVNNARIGIHLEALVPTTPPTISALSVSPANTLATIYWTTDEVANAAVDYGTSATYTTHTAADAYTTSHTIALPSLAQCTTYHYQVRSVDIFGNQTISPDQAFKTTGCQQASALPITATNTAPLLPTTLPAVTAPTSSQPVQSTATQGEAAPQTIATSTVAPPPQTNGELVTEIQHLLDLLHSLEEQLAIARSSAVRASPQTNLHSSSLFPRNLHLDMTGSDVRRLQTYLDTHGTPVAISGPGSLGQETKYFGARTKNALILFQNQHATQILTPAHLTYGTGYFGSATRSYVIAHP